MKRYKYIVTHKNDWEFFPDSNANSHTLMQKRGIPSLFTQSRNSIRMTLIHYDSKNLAKNGKPISETNTTILTSMSASSSYLGILSDNKMRAYIFSKISFWSAQYMKFCSEIKYNKIAVQIQPRRRRGGTVRMADGGIWDNAALATTLAGFHQEGILSARPLILVFHSYEFDTSLWWSNAKNRSEFFPEIALFKGLEKDHLKLSIRRTHSLMKVYTGLETQQTCIQSWIPEGQVIDLASIQLDAKYLPSFPLVDRDKWSSYVARIRKYLPVFFRTIQEEFPNQLIGFSMSGGGIRATMATSCILKIAHEMSLTPTIIGANSGGAWGLSIFDDPVSYLFSCCGMIRFNSFHWRFTSYLINLFFDSKTSGFFYMVPFLKKFDWDWEAMVSKILCTPKSHDKLFQRFPTLRRIVFTSTLLCNSDAA